jgi:hypothetical protein
MEKRSWKKEAWFVLAKKDFACLTKKRSSSSAKIRVYTSTNLLMGQERYSCVQYPVAGSAMPHVQLDTHVELLSHVETFGFTYITQKQ